MGYSVVDVADIPAVMKPGRYVLVPAESRRRPGAGPDGMSFIVIGGVPDGVYEPWSPPNE